ncbi:alpha-1,2-fucosyltransferase [Spirosoma sp. BT702]|uniref:Alpha-1,2-fucosyltransferase n=1 Tax=Spirosoma profusum TaxID=2771354 RepID=A0A927ATB3_9BACT|nr:alpha-1,2-fucosyltransferase [Spirosoma profusum]MBD2699762.1 alpha-1,2-fucosyltransferase [Spirosoma profusum]
MVISVLAGGLGNQLFQYAFGFRMARQLQTELRLERHMLESQTLARLRNYTPRQYELDVFGITNAEASWSDTLLSLSRTLLSGHQVVLLRESEPATLAKVSARTKDVLCVGYWQSEDYFKSESEALRTQLRFQKRPSDATLAVADSIRTHPNATFVHIRRGDYVTNAITNQHHGVCGEAYYQQAVRYVRERAADTHFFVFSDDQTWVKRELGALLSPATFIEHNKGADSWQDMYLMSLCRNAIVANSSFSWWGAWLNGQSERIVVAPQRWFAADKSSYPSVVPPHWITV